MPLNLLPLLFFILVGIDPSQTMEINDIFRQINLDPSHTSQFVFSDSPVQVALIDTGYDTTHEILRKCLDVENGFSVRLKSGRNVAHAEINESIIRNKLKTNFGQQSCHGTHIAGILITTYGALTTLKNFPAFRPIVPIKIDTNCTSLKNFIYALKKIKDNKSISVVNLSWNLGGGKKGKKALAPELKLTMLEVMQTGKIIVLAAGNNGVKYNSNAYTQSVYDLAVQAKGRLIVVGATQLINNKEELLKHSAFSDYKMSPYFIVAPGYNIESLVPFSISPTGTATMTGTSLSAPIVAGVLGRLITDFPQLSIDELSSILRLTARQQYNENGNLCHSFGCGIINVAEARRVASNYVSLRSIHSEQFKILRHRHKTEHLTLHMYLKRFQLQRYHHTPDNYKYLLRRLNYQEYFYLNFLLYTNHRWEYTFMYSQQMARIWSPYNIS